MPETIDLHKNVAQPTRMDEAELNKECAAAAAYFQAKFLSGAPDDSKALGMNCFAKGFGAGIRWMERRLADAKGAPT